MSFELMEYKPNWSDPRVRRRAQIALNWCDYHLSETRERSASKNKLDKVFGSSGRGLSDYLRGALIVEDGKSYSVGGFSKKYFLNKKGYVNLQEELGFLEEEIGEERLDIDSSKKSSMPFFNSEYEGELSDLKFKMKEFSHRLWHPLQNICRERKDEFWVAFGLPYDYDIEACAPTILFQLAKDARVPEILQEPVRAYLNDRNELRMHVAGLTGLSINDSKRLINSFFNGARLAANGYCSAFRMLEYNFEIMERLKNDLEIQRLRKNISTIWKRLELVERHKQIGSFDDLINGKIEPVKKMLKTPRQKWGLYFEHERRILDVIIDELNEKNIRYFPEHDGFRSKERIDIDFLQEKIYEKTKFKIKINEKKTNH